MKNCSVSNCTRAHYAKGMCNLHWSQVRSGRAPDGPTKIRRAGQVLIRDEHGRKLCIACKAWHPESKFSSHGKTKDGLQVRCISCVGMRSRFLTYGVSEARLKEMLEHQNNRCAICESDISIRHLIDHDHACCPDRQRKTCGKCVRGLLCDACNLGLGAFADSTQNLLRAVAYVEKFRTRESK